MAAETILERPSEGTGRPADTAQPLARRVTRGGWIVHPLALTAAYVLNFWIETGVSPFAVVRALVVALAAMAVVQLLATAVLRDRHRGGLATSAIFVIITGWTPELRLLATVIALAVVAALIWWILRSGRPLSRVSYILNVFAAILLVGVAVKALGTSTLSYLPNDLRQGGGLPQSAGELPQAAPPDIYILLLDGYPGAESQRRLFGTDPQPFESGLRQRGFRLPATSRSNYTLTVLTFVSMFNMKHLDELPEVRPLLGTPAKEQPVMRHLINDSAAFHLLHDHGYQIVWSASGWEGSAYRQADAFLDDGQLNEFEIALMRATAIAPWANGLGIDLIGPQQRSRILAGFEHMRQVARTPSDKPRFVFIHIPSPHPPVVFDAQGGPQPVDQRHPYEWVFAGVQDRATVVERYREQLAYLDGLVFKAVDDVIASSSRPPVVIVMSDHGARSRLDADPALRLQETVDNFLASYTPGRSDLFTGTVTPVNVLPEIFDAYLGTSLPRSDDRSLASAGSTVFELTEVVGPSAR
jgi:hypothetical protein